MRRAGCSRGVLSRVRWAGSLARGAPAQPRAAAGSSWALREPNWARHPGGYAPASCQNPCLRFGCSFLFKLPLFI